MIPESSRMWKPCYFWALPKLGGPPTQIFLTLFFLQFFPQNRGFCLIPYGQGKNALFCRKIRGFTEIGNKLSIDLFNRFPQLQVRWIGFTQSMASYIIIIWSFVCLPLLIHGVFFSDFDPHTGLPFCQVQVRLCGPGGWRIQNYPLARADRPSNIFLVNLFHPAPKHRS